MTSGIHVIHCTINVSDTCTATFQIEDGWEYKSNGRIGIQIFLGVPHGALPIFLCLYNLQPLLFVIDVGHNLDFSFACLR